MSDASETLAGDLERALEQIARVVGEVGPGNDVFEPQGLVHRWLAGLDPKDSGRFLMLLGSEQWEAELTSIARCVVSGATAWPAAAVPADSTTPVTPATPSAPSPQQP